MGVLNRHSFHDNFDSDDFCDDNNEDTVLSPTDLLHAHVDSLQSDHFSRLSALLAETGHEHGGSPVRLWPYLSDKKPSVTQDQGCHWPSKVLAGR